MITFVSSSTADTYTQYPEDDALLPDLVPGEAGQTLAAAGGGGEVVAGGAGGGGQQALAPRYYR